MIEKKCPICEKQYMEKATITAPSGDKKIIYIHGYTKTDIGKKIGLNIRKTISCE